MRRGWFDRLTIFLSAVPIGVLMNVLRITVTVWLYQVADAHTARVVFHDVAGWVMMPAALLLMWLELLFLSRLWLPQEREIPVPVPAPRKSSPASPPRWAARRPQKVSRPEATAELSLQEIRDAAP
jgi:exosortase/archaeosortase family protein